MFSINFVKIFPFSYFLSGILITLSIFFFFTNGINFGIDFTGGTVLEVRLPKEISTNTVRNELNKILDVSFAVNELLSSSTQTHDLLIKVGSSEQGGISNVEKIKKVFSSIISSNNYNMNLLEYRKTDYVGPSFGAELMSNGIIALIIGFGMVIIYLYFRFSIQYSIGGILTLLHDIILLIGFYSYTQFEFDTSSIAALLTIVGYSINDTVVIYDRIRERMYISNKSSLKEILNTSLNSTLRRTLYTSLTTISALIVLVLFGGHVLLGFASAILFGLVIGTYSSIFMSTLTIRKILVK